MSINISWGVGGNMNQKKIVMVSYVVDVVNVADLNTAYGMMVKKAEPEEVWKLLNSFAFH